MYMNVIDLSKSVSFVLEDIDIGGQIQYLTCTGSFRLSALFYIKKSQHSVLIKLIDSTGSPLLSDGIVFILGPFFNTL